MTGVDDRGRPKAEWDDAPAEAPPYAFMEPAIPPTITRRQATTAELEAARAREAVPDHLTKPGDRSAPFGAMTSPPTPATAERMQASRLIGAQRHAEAVAATKRPTPAQREWNGHAAEPPAQPEEPIVTDEPEYVPAADVGLDLLATAAETARLAWDDRAAADHAWDIARDALARAYAAVEWIIRPPIVTIGLDHDNGSWTFPLQAPSPIIQRAAEEAAAIRRGPAPRRNAVDEKTDGLTARQATAIDHLMSGKTRAQTAALMDCTHQTIDGLMEAALKKGLLPAELYPVLPGRFAKLIPKAATS